MKKNLKKLLAVALVAYSSSVFSSSTVTTKSTEPSVVGVNHGLSYIKVPDLYNDRYVVQGGTSVLSKENQQHEEPLGGTLNVVLGWEQVWNGARGSDSLAAGFGHGAGNGLKFTYSPDKTLMEGTSDVRKIIHMHYPVGIVGGADPFSSYGNSVMNLSAKHRRMFVDLSYVQDLSNFYEGLRFGVSTAVVRVTNKLEVNSELENNPIKFTLPTTNTTTPPLVADDYNNLTASTFFSASVPAKTGMNSQTTLMHGRMTGSEESKTALNDIRVWLGLDVLNTDSGSVLVAVEGVIPTGQELVGTNLWEPMAGNRFFKLGAKLDALANLADGSDYSVNLNLQAFWHYSVARNVVRLPYDSTVALNHYSLGYVLPSSGALDGAVLTPVIDIVFKEKPKVKVTPGHTASLLANVCFEKGCLVLDACYNLRWTSDEKSDEYTSILKDIYVANFDNALSQTTARTKASNDTTGWNNSGGSKLALQNLKCVAKSQTVHSAKVSVGFVNKESQYPFGVNLSAGYDYVPCSSRSTTPQTWNLSAKGTFCF